MLEVIGYTNAVGRDLFNRWFNRLDHRAAALVAGAIANMENDYFPDARHVGQGVWEYRIHAGPGIRIYYARESDRVVILLAGGTKNTRRGQQNDIARARSRWQDWRERRDAR